MSAQVKRARKEGLADSEDPEEDSQDLNMQNIRRSFQRLRVQHTQPGSDRPDLSYYLTVAFWIVMAGWWVFSIFIQMNRFYGHFLEGKTGFVLMLIARSGLISLGIAGLVWWKKSLPEQHRWKGQLAAVCLAVTAFLVLLNPIRDIFCLANPAETVLHDCTLYADTDLENAAVFSVWGRDEEEQLVNFDINESTMCDPSFSVQGKELRIEYLPYTKTVLSITVQ